MLLSPASISLISEGNLQPRVASVDGKGEAATLFVKENAPVSGNCVVVFDLDPLSNVPIWWL
jgi:hypothetical protein